MMYVNQIIMLHTFNLHNYCVLSHVWLFCEPVDCSLPGSFVHGILQIRILEFVGMPFSRGSSWPRDWTQVSHTAGRFFTIWATRLSLGIRWYNGICQLYLNKPGRKKLRYQVIMCASRSCLCPLLSVLFWVFYVLSLIFNLPFMIWDYNCI